MRTFEIGYIVTNNNNHTDKHDAVRLTVMDSRSEKMVTELLNSFNNRITECHSDRYRITYIKEVLSNKIEDE